MRAVKANVAATVPKGRFGRPEEAAAVVAFLASEESSYVVGVNLYVDGLSSYHPLLAPPLRLPPRRPAVRPVRVGWRGSRHDEPMERAGVSAQVSRNVARRFHSP